MTNFDLLEDETIMLKSTQEVGKGRGQMVN